MRMVTRPAAVRLNLQSVRTHLCVVWGEVFPPRLAFKWGRSCHVVGMWWRRGPVVGWIDDDFRAWRLLLWKRRFVLGGAQDGGGERSGDRDRGDEADGPAEGTHDLDSD